MAGFLKNEVKAHVKADYIFEIAKDLKSYCSHEIDNTNMGMDINGFYVLLPEEYADLIILKYGYTDEK